MQRRQASPGLATLASLVFLCACGSEFAGDNPGSDGGNTGNDAAGSECSLGLVMPALGTIGEEIELAVEVIPAGQPGARDFRWRVSLEGVEQNLTPLADPLDRVSFVPQAAGPYQVEVESTIGLLDCWTASDSLTVTADGALSEDYRMRVLPLSGAPMQDFQVRIYGGTNSALPATHLEAGLLANGSITDSGGAPVAAYMRARKRGTLAPMDYEGFASASGNFSLLIPPTDRYDLLIVPSSGLLPSQLLADVAISDISGAISLPAPVSLSGHVQNSVGAPVQGALVSLNIDGAETTSALSTADGSFTVLGQIGELSGLKVAPVAGSGMPALRAEGLAGQTVNGASDVVIQYANATVNAQVDLTLEGGAAAAGALVEWRSVSVQSATVNVGASEPVPGVLRVMATADASGRAQAPLAAGVADLVAHSSDATEAIVVPDLDWAASPTTARGLEALVPISIGVSFASAAAEGARVLAVPVGSLAPQAAALAATVSASGTASVSLIRGGSYEIVAADASKGTEVSSVADVSIATVAPVIELPGTITASGHVSIAGNNAKGARISLYCDSCSGDEATRVRAQAVADSTGRFVLRVSDPGIAAP